MIKKICGQERKLLENLAVGEKVLILAEKIKKKSAPRKFPKKLFKSYNTLTKKAVFTIKSKQKIFKKTYFWLENEEYSKYSLKRFEKSKLFAIVDNFVL